MDSKKQFLDFLKLTKSQKEIALVIAKDDNELKLFHEILDGSDFRQVVDFPELLKRMTASSKLYFIVRNNLPKEMYDFIMQYPTGQIEIFDKNTMTSKTFTPLYKDTSVVFVLTKEVLRNIQEKGIQLLESAGIAYQN